MEHSLPGYARLFRKAKEHPIITSAIGLGTALITVANHPEWSEHLSGWIGGAVRFWSYAPVQFSWSIILLVAAIYISQDLWRPFVFGNRKRRRIGKICEDLDNIEKHTARFSGVDLAMTAGAMLAECHALGAFSFNSALSGTLKNVATGESDTMKHCGWPANSPQFQTFFATLTTAENNTSPLAGPEPDLRLQAIRGCGLIATWIRQNNKIRQPKRRIQRASPQSPPSLQP